MDVSTKSALAAKTSYTRATNGRACYEFLTSHAHIPALTA